MKEVFVVFIGDVWLTDSSLRVKAVCSDFRNVIIVVKDILQNEGIKSREDIPDDDDETLTVEDYVEEFQIHGQCRGHDFAITYENFNMNEKPYSV